MFGYVVEGQELLQQMQVRMQSAFVCDRQLQESYSMEVLQQMQVRI